MLVSSSFDQNLVVWDVTNSVQKFSLKVHILLYTQIVNTNHIVYVYQHVERWERERKCVWGRGGGARTGGEGER